MLPSEVSPLPPLQGDRPLLWCVWFELRAPQIALDCCSAVNPLVSQNRARLRLSERGEVTGVTAFPKVFAWWLACSSSGKTNRQRVARAHSAPNRKPRLCYVAVIRDAASRIASRDARSRSLGTSHEKITKSRGGARMMHCINYCAHCVPTQFFILSGQSSTKLAAVCV